MTSRSSRTMASQGYTEGSRRRRPRRRASPSSAPHAAAPDAASLAASPAEEAAQAEEAALRLLLEWQVVPLQATDRAQQLERPRASGQRARAEDQQRAVDECIPR